MFPPLRRASALRPPRARVIVLVDKTERRHVDKLNDILPLHAVLQQPVSAADLEAALQA